jgi:hypothetical protein
MNLPCVLYLIRDLVDSRLLCARCEWPGDHRATDERDHVSPCRLIELHLLPQPEIPMATYHCLGREGHIHFYAAISMRRHSATCIETAMAIFLQWRYGHMVQNLVERQVAVIVGNLSAERFWEVP